MKGARTHRRARAGFTLLEVLAALAIVALVVFPALQIVQEAQKDTFDAKLATLCVGKMRSLLSEITRTAKAGTSSEGDLSTLSDEEGFDKRFAFSNVRYEWQCRSADLSLDLLPDSELTEDEKKDEEERKRRQEDAGESDSLDQDIDERFRARYVRIACTYLLESGEEKQIVVETYVPPLPSEDKLKKGADGRTYVEPNSGGGG
jgi:prepilin-type N-terminal cleavage/methylation domain-containing protein